VLGGGNDDLGDRFFRICDSVPAGLHEYGVGFFSQRLPTSDVQSEFHFHAPRSRVPDVIGFDAISTFRRSGEPARNILLLPAGVPGDGVLSSLEVYAAQLVLGLEAIPAGAGESAFPLVPGRWGIFFCFNC